MIMYTIRSSGISIHAPAGGASAITTSLCTFLAISIHAPAGGASIIQVKKPCHEFISIHAPAGGASSNQSLTF